MYARRRVSNVGPSRVALCGMQTRAPAYRWRRRASSTETSATRRSMHGLPRCFNGAVELHRRRHPLRRMHRDPAVEASMVLSIFIDRDAFLLLFGIGSRALLQWCCRSSSTETGSQPPRPRLDPAASMVLSIFIDRDGHLSLDASRVPHCFNGAVELHRQRRRTSSPVAMPPCCFNGAVDLHRQRRSGGSVCAGGGVRASMVLSIFIDRDDHRGDLQRRIDFASMVLSIFIDRDAPRGAPRKRDEIPLQWCCRSSSTETSRTRTRW